MTTVLAASSGIAGASLTMDDRGAITLTGPAPASVTPSGNAGTGATATIQAGSNDVSGIINLTTGTGAAGGDQATVAFSSAMALAPRLVLFTRLDAVSGSLPANFSATSLSTAGFHLFSSATPTSSTAFKIGYLCIW